MRRRLHVDYAVGRKKYLFALILFYMRRVLLTAMCCERWLIGRLYLHLPAVLKMTHATDGKYPACARPSGSNPKTYSTLAGMAPAAPLRGSVAMLGGSKKCVACNTTLSCGRTNSPYFEQLNKIALHDFSLRVLSMVSFWIYF